jgi:CPA1 family monovalent cation:H+ antiporter
MNGLASNVQDLLLILLTALAVAIAARFARIPYTVGLVVAGLAIGLFPNHPRIALTPNLIMVVFLPALLFAGAWEMQVAELRRNWLPIALLATVGVLAGIAISYALLVYGGGIDPRIAIIFSAVVAATDPVAVIAVFRELGLDRRLSTILEGESLFNDGTAVVAFRTLLLATAGSIGAFEFHPLAALGQFAVMTLGGAAAGILTGLLASVVLKATDDYLVEATATTAVAYGSYLLAEAFDASGIVAVIVSGLVLSGVGTALGSFTRQRQSVNQFWEFIAFLANSVLFVLVGLSFDVHELGAVLGASVWGVGAVIVSRIVIVYGLTQISAAAGSRLPWSWRHILALGGLRGALPMALVLSLAEDFQGRSQVIAMVYSVVLFTLVAQGLSLRPAIALLGLTAQREHAA